MELDFDKAVDINTTVMDLQGHIIHSMELKQVKNKVVGYQLNNLPGGVYLVRIEAGAKIYTRKILLNN